MYVWSVGVIYYLAPQGKAWGTSCGLASLITLRGVFVVSIINGTPRRVQGFVGGFTASLGRPIQHVGERALPAVEKERTVIRELLSYNKCFC